MRECEKFGRTSAPFLPQHVQVNLDSMSELHIVGPAIGVGFDVMATSMIAAIDQHVADAGFAHLAEGDLLRGGRHGQRLVVTLPTLRPNAS